MPDWCDHGPKEHYYESLSAVSTYIMYVLLAAGVIVSVIATYLIFCMRDRTERPLFVSLQVILLNFFWILFIVYCYMEKNIKTEEGEGKVSNLVVTVADLFITVHDWLLTEKFLSSSLLLPVVLDMTLKGVDPSRAKKRAMCWFRVM